MKAIVQDGYGSADVLRLAEIDRPEIAANEVLVKVHAAGMDRGTWHVHDRPAVPDADHGVRVPSAEEPGPGLDVAGTVEAVGSDVTRFTDRRRGVRHQPGLVRRVRGCARGQAGPQACRPQLRAGGGRADLRGHRDPGRCAGRIEAGQKVLIIGASGGVGTYAVQLAKALGAEVTGVCSTAKLDLVSSIGADHVIDYTRAGLRRRRQALRPNPRHRREQQPPELRRALAPKGTLVIVGGEEGGEVDRRLRPAAPRGRDLAVRRSTTDDARLQGGPRPRRGVSRFIEAGQVTPIIDKTYPLAEVPDAMRHLEAGKARGKIAIRI